MVHFCVSLINPKSRKLLVDFADDKFRFLLLDDQQFCYFHPIIVIYWMWSDKEPISVELFQLNEAQEAHLSFINAMRPGVSVARPGVCLYQVASIIYPYVWRELHPASPARTGHAVTTPLVY